MHLAKLKCAARSYSFVPLVFFSFKWSSKWVKALSCSKITQ